jgi:hypothetical protein
MDFLERGGSLVKMPWTLYSHQVLLDDVPEATQSKQSPDGSSLHADSVVATMVLELGRCLCWDTAPPEECRVLQQGLR